MYLYPGVAERIKSLLYWRVFPLRHPKALKTRLHMLVGVSTHLPSILPFEEEAAKEGLPTIMPPWTGGVLHS